MALTRKRIVVTTAADGSYETEVHMQGALRGVLVDIGDLSTPDLEITDTLDDETLFAVAGIAGDARYYPQVPDTDASDGTAGDGFVAPMIFQRATVSITGGGNVKTGTIYLLIER